MTFLCLSRSPSLTLPSCAGIIYPILLNQLFPRIGFGWTVRAAAFLTLAMLVTAILTVRSRLPPRKVEKIFDFSPLREKAFLLVTIGETIIMLCVAILPPASLSPSY